MSRIVPPFLAVLCLTVFGMANDPSATSRASTPPGVAIVMKASKPTYEPAEPIHVTIELRNAGDKTLEVLGTTRPLFPHVMFECWREGATAKDHADGVELRRLHYIRLEIGQTLRIDTCLSQLFDMRSQGIYRVTARLIGSWGETKPDGTGMVRFPIGTDALSIQRELGPAISATVDRTTKGHTN